MYSWIDDILHGLKETYNTDKIFELLDCINITIIKLDCNNILLRGNESFYNRDHLGNEVIFIRNDLNLEFEKFVLAHELGHALLHTHMYEAAFNKSLINSCKLEKQANYFAFNLLKFDIDSSSFEGFTLEQIAHSLCIPLNCLNAIQDKF